MPATDIFSDGQTRTMLQNSVYGIDDLRQVKNTADHLATSDGSKVKNDAYIMNILSYYFLLLLLLTTPNLSRRKQSDKYSIMRLRNTLKQLKKWSLMTLTA